MQGELLADGSKRISLSREQYGRIEQILRNFFVRTKCGAIVVADVSGMQVARAGTIDKNATALLGTLSAGNYAATNEMAKLIGEDGGFKVTFLEGNKSHLYVSGVDESFLLIVVFSEPNTFGMVRIQTAKIAEELREIFRMESTGEQVEIVPEEVHSAEFRDELSSRLDSVLFSTNK